LPLLHPGMADLYRAKMARLAEALEHPETRSEAAEAIRGLIDAVVLTPADGALEAFAAHRASRSPSAIVARQRPPHRAERESGRDAGGGPKRKRSPDTGDLVVRMAVVAGAGFEPATFGL
jgi:site-specific DNA recombinase